MLSQQIAGGAGANDLVNYKAARDVFQLFGDIFAQGLQIATTFIASLTRGQYLLVTIQVARQWFAFWFFLWHSLFFMTLLPPPKAQ